MHNQQTTQSCSANKNIRVLCFDFGTKRIGVAVGNSLTSTSQPLDTLQVKQQCLPWQLIEELVTKWHPDHLVVGLPLSMDGEETSMCQQVKSFASQLRQKTNLTITLCDERLSTDEADSIIKTFSSSTDATQYKNRDSIAAQQILHTFFDTI